MAVPACRKQGRSSCQTLPLPAEPPCPAAPPAPAKGPGLGSGPGSPQGRVPAGWEAVAGLISNLFPVLLSSRARINGASTSQVPPAPPGRALTLSPGVRAEPDPAWCKAAPPVGSAHAGDGSGCGTLGTSRAGGCMPAPVPTRPHMPVGWGSSREHRRQTLHPIPPQCWVWLGGVGKGEAWRTGGSLCPAWGPPDPQGPAC